MATEAELLERAHEMRRNPTEWEKRLWRHLSGSQIGYKFRRQHVIWPYIYDFFCPARNLVVEIDGDTHDAVRDAARDDMMASRGVKTLRFTNLEVRENTEGVLTMIGAALRSSSNRWSGRPHPNPSPEGEGLE